MISFSEQIVGVVPDEASTGCGVTRCSFAGLARPHMGVADLSIKPKSTITWCLTGHPVQDNYPLHKEKFISRGIPAMHRRVPSYYARIPGLFKT